MRKELRTNAANKVAAQLIPAETAVDIAVAELAGLMSTILTARIEANLPMSTAHSAINAVSEAIAMMTDVRSKVVEAHCHLADTKRDIGLRTVGFGDMGCPPASAEGGDNVISIAA